MKCKLYINDRSMEFIVVRSTIQCPKGYYVETFDDLQSRDNMISDLFSEGYSKEIQND